MADYGGSSGSSNNFHSRRSKKILAPLPPTLYEDDGKVVDGSPRLYRCKYCGKEFVKHQALGGHQRTHKRQRLEEAAAAINIATAPAMAITTDTVSLIHQLSTPSNPPGAASTFDFPIPTATSTSLEYQFDLNFPPTEIPEFEFDLNYPPRD